jgi:hypothetical protein
MKTTIVATLLLLGTLALAGSALADPIDDAVATAGAVASCAASVVGPDGQPEHVGNVYPGVDAIDQDPACLD